ncbi:penicillin-binding protein 2 [Halieaceae bacterium IMCC14734]|uniref:Peptidoglycan D,D-transpeptidase FtsI n=1 Tax=Candidatus Litorirhabdus singularis TaxID=2518993 RepID=A0ABT3TJB6_9GAMM|nr:penicillin-binding protein 2 [Candidatus Litorirhabdus singularis]MCX2982408.1 penicillin-binding protein 2 [Candidatus Litorirhabdus singularis]
MRKSQLIPISPWRLPLMAIVISLLFCLLLWKLLSLQVMNSDRGSEFLRDQGEARYLRNAVIPAYRGLISDRRGEPLAVSAPVVSLWADPARLAASERVAELAVLIDLSESQLREKLERYANKRFMYLQRRMSPERARPVLDAKFPGVGSDREYRRYYPAGEVAAHVVGLTNIDGKGIEGLELSYDQHLASQSGRKQVIKDRHGNVVRDVGELRAPVFGRDLTLSIDLRLQYLAHRELHTAIKLTGARAGSVVTMDSRTGEVLALANFPFYNPNNLRGVEPGQRRNRALIDAFEPGSTMKPVAVAAALHSGKFSPQTLIDTAPGRIQVGRKVLHDPVNYGEIDLARVVVKSSQVGMVKVALALDAQAVWQMYRGFGFGVHPGTGFPGESSGVLPYREKWRPIERATLAYGHGLTATPLQLAQAYSVFANAGRRVSPSLLRLEPEDVVSERVLSRPLAAQMLEILEGVTADIGTGKRARVAGYRVGGKTGTAHKASAGGYSDNRYLALFVGVAPISDPRLVTVVLLDEPAGDRYHGGEVAAPVFSRVMAGALRLLNIVPDQITHQIAAAEAV